MVLIKLVFLLAIIMVSSTPTFAELQVSVYMPLYEPQRYNPLFTGYTNIFCSPPTLSVGLTFVHPCLAEVELWMENQGTWTNVGPVLRTAMYRKAVDATGIYGKVKLRAQHGGPGSAVTVTPYCSAPPAEQAETEIYVDRQRPACSGFKFINAKTKSPGSGINMQSPVVAHFEKVTDDVPWDKYEYQVRMDNPDTGERHQALNNNFQVELPEGRHTYFWNVTDGCDRSIGWNRGEVIVDNTPPTLYINKPLQNEKFFSSSSIEVEVFIGDVLSGLRSVDLFVDRVDGTPNAQFRGPWRIGDFLNKDSVSTNIREPGKHKLYVVAEDKAGNKTQISRDVEIQRPLVIQPTDKKTKK